MVLRPMANDRVMKRLDLQQIEQKEKRRSQIITSIILGAILAIIFFLPAFSYPDPPIEEKEVIMFDWSAAASGGGTEAEMEASAASAAEEVEQPSAPEDRQADVISETEVSDEAPVDAKPHVNDNPVDDKPTVDPGSLYPGDKGSSNNNSAGGGTGSGDSNGSGTESGSGTGMGGDGYSLAGRGIVNKPVIHGSFQQEGTVVVDIFVDRQGHVVRVKANRRKSNTSSSELISRAEAAAKKARFSVKPDAAIEQKGTITFVFRKG